MIALVGYTGFVGSNIYSRARNRIDGVFDSKNIEKAYGLEPEVLIYAGIRSEKYLANREPYKDMEMILQAEENIKKINPQKLVLISTIDVYNNPVEVDETDAAFTNKTLKNQADIQPYGLNRYYLESWVRKNYPDALIIRLPGLYGFNIKKNFIYDYINVIPFMIDEEKYKELKALEKVQDDIMLDDCYELLENGFYRCKALNSGQKEMLKKKLIKLKFTALNFTDSRSLLQFYPLSRLLEDIQTAVRSNISLLNLATEPVLASELYKELTGEVFKNEFDTIPPKYDFRSIHAEKFGGKSGYICSKEDIIADIRQFTQYCLGEKDYK